MFDLLVVSTTPLTNDQRYLHWRARLWLAVSDAWINQQHCPTCRYNDQGECLTINPRDCRALFPDAKRLA